MVNQIEDWRLVEKMNEVGIQSVRQLGRRRRVKRRRPTGLDIRRGVAERLINRGVSAETLKVIM